MKSTSRISAVLEIIFSTFIFIVIVFVCVYSLVGMNSNLKQLQSLDAATKCESQIAKEVSDHFAFSENAASAIFGIKREDNFLKFVELGDEPGQKGNYSGFVSIQQGDNSHFKAVLVLKVPADKMAVFKTAEISLSEDRRIRHGELVEKFFSENDYKTIGKCWSALEQNGAKFHNPFFLARSNNSILLRIDDFIFGADKTLSSRLFLLKEKTYD